MYIDKNTITFWTESTNCLNWINFPSSAPKTFVANRVGEVHTHRKHCQLRHILSILNPPGGGEDHLLHKIQFLLLRNGTKLIMWCRVIIFESIKQICFYFMIVTHEIGGWKRQVWKVVLNGERKYLEVNVLIQKCCRVKKLHKVTIKNFFNCNYWKV